MHRREILEALSVSAAGAVAIYERSEAQTCTAPCYPTTAAESAAGVTIYNHALIPGQVDRYLIGTDATAAFQSAVAQAQQLSSGIPIGAPITVNSVLTILGNVTIPAATVVRGVATKATAMLQIISGGIHIASGRTLQINGTFSAPRITCFLGEGAAAFGAGACVEAYPEWWGARPDSAPGTRGTIAVSGTDCTSSINAALLACGGGAAVKVGLIPLRLAAGYYLCGNVTLYPASCVRGAGREVSGVLASEAAGTGGTRYWWTDNGSASKIVLEDLAMYGCYAVATNVNTLCRLGYGATPFGTEGYIRGMWFRDCASSGGGWALDLQSNVGFFDLISIYGNNLANQNLLRLSAGGGGNMFSKIAIIGAGPNCSSFYCNGPGTVIDGLEIEAPGSTNTASTVCPLYLGNNTVIHGLTLSGADGIAQDAWIEFGPHCTAWEISGIKFFSGNYRTAIVGRGNGKRADGSYFGGNATGFGAWSSAMVPYRPGNIVFKGGYVWICIHANTSGRANGPPNTTYWTHYSGPYTPGEWNSRTTYYAGSIVRYGGYNYIGVLGNANQAPPNSTYWAPFIPEPAPISGEGHWSSDTDGQRLQSFTLSIQNNGKGTLQHRISEPGGATTNLASVIYSATATFTNTPTGPDGSVALVAGGKIGSASPNIFWLDTPNQMIEDTIGMASISLNTTGTALNVVALVFSANINGAVRNRLCFRLTNAANGDYFALTPANFGGSAGKAILQITWMGHLSS